MAFNSLEDANLYWTLEFSFMTYQVSHPTLGLLSSALVPGYQTCCHMLGSVIPLPTSSSYLNRAFISSSHSTFYSNVMLNILKIMTTQP